MAQISKRIVEDNEKVAIQAPCREFGEAVRADPRLTQEYIDLSRRATGFFASVLPQTPIVLADNVTDYLCGDEAIRSNAKWDLKDVPVVTPPFKGVFLETASPRHFDNHDMRGWGAYFSRLDGAEGIESSEIPADRVKWTVEMALVYDDKGVLKTYPAVWTFYLDGDGQLLRDRRGDILVETATLVAGPGLAEAVVGSQRWEDLKESVFTLMLPFFWSFGFMHCRNVSLDAQIVSRQARRQAERRGTPMLDCRVLNIEPMRRVLGDEGRLSEVGPQKALHICRGHFKTYTQDRPLFGKIAGTFWWEGSVRGSMMKGEVAKYDSNAVSRKSIRRIYNRLEKGSQMNSTVRCTRIQRTMPETSFRNNNNDQVNFINRLRNRGNYGDGVFAVVRHKNSIFIKRYHSSPRSFYRSTAKSTDTRRHRDSVRRPKQARSKEISG